MKQTLFATLALLAAPSLLGQTTVAQKTFKKAQQAADALVAAAEKFDVPALKEILGPDGVDLVVTGDAVQDKNRAEAFAAKAREKSFVAPDPASPKSAIFYVGADDWPLPIPIVEEGKTWRFDSKAGRQETLFRRIGENELDAIEVCRGYVEAQHEYAFLAREAVGLAQYAQHIVSTPGKRDGLAWRDPDGSWKGPVGETIARAIAEGYTAGIQPYHGYMFKILKGQGANAPLGELDFVVKGVMIGGFALVAAPAEYEISGIKSFIVSHDGVVYEKDLGLKTLEVFKAMERFDPDETWSPVTE